MYILVVYTFISHIHKIKVLKTNRILKNRRILIRLQLVRETLIFKHPINETNHMHAALFTYKIQKRLCNELHKCINSCLQDVFANNTWE